MIAQLKWQWRPLPLFMKSFIIVCIFTSSFMITIYFHKKTATFPALRVAHAGGSIENKTYTNSYEALNKNIQNGFTYFELDFVFTSDKELVCLHDWQGSFKRSFGFSTDKRLSLKEFIKLVNTKSKFTKCTLSGLSEWMRQNPSAVIITDVKEYNLPALQLIHATLPNASKRVIPQIYYPQNFDKVKNMGFDRIIWTLYRYRGSDKEVLDWTNRFYGAFAITMPKDKAKTSLPNELKKKSIPTYVHTVNTNEEYNQFVLTHGITEIYTDSLVPHI